jgi:hypothetical protein
VANLGDVAVQATMAGTVQLVCTVCGEVVDVEDLTAVSDLANVAGEHQCSEQEEDREETYGPG